MAWPATQNTLQTTLAQVSSQALTVANTVTALRDQSAAGVVSRARVVSVIRTIRTAVAIWNAAAAVPGIAAYAREQFSDTGLDVAAAFSAMVTQAEELANWIESAFPKDPGSGAWLIYTVGADGNLTELTFTTAEMAGFRSRADLFLGTIS